VFTQADAKIGTVFQRAGHAKWWKTEEARVQKLVADGLVSEGDYAQFRRMGHFVRHVPDILSLVQDTLRPRKIEDLIRYAFDDPPK
jgi:internalin A